MTYICYGPEPFEQLWKIKTKDHSCKGWSNSNQWFRRCCLKIVDGRTSGRRRRRQTVSDHNSSPWAFSSGELKHKYLDTPGWIPLLPGAMIISCVFRLMHQSFVVPASTGPENSWAVNFSVFKALLNALHCGDKFMVKSLLKACLTWGQFFVSWNSLLSVANINLYLFQGNRSGLLDTA